VSDVAKAAKDWPQLNFIIYHGGYRFAGGGNVEDAWAQFEQTGRIEWITDLSEIPAKHGVKNVYADVGQLFAQSTIADPRVSAVMIGQLIKGMGSDHVCWGTDAIWTGSPQWQIEALRRLEIPEELRRKYALQPLGPADGPVKTAIFGGNNARLYNYKPQHRAALENDRLASYREPSSLPVNFYVAYYQSQRSGHLVHSPINCIPGGGWTTTLYAAIDPTIRCSFPVAGSIPLYLRTKGSVGDREQFEPSFYSIAGYPDLYVLGAHGRGRDAHRQSAVERTGGSARIIRRRPHPRLAGSEVSYRSSGRARPIRGKFRIQC